MLLMSLEKARSRFDQSILNWTSDLCRKDRSSIHRTRNRLFPSSQHLNHLGPSIVIDSCIAIHEDSEDVATEEESVRRANIFDYRIEYIESWEFFGGSDLEG